MSKSDLILITVVVMLIVSFLMILMLLHLKRTFRLKKKIEYVADNAGYMGSMLETLCGSRNVIRNVRFPPCGDCCGKLCGPDYIIVNSGGVIVVTVKSLNGYIENPMRGDWRRFGNNGTVQFENPFEKGNMHIHAVSKILNADDISDVPIKNMIIFTRSDVKFKNKFSQIFSPERAVAYIERQRRTHVIDKKTEDRIVTILDRYSKTAQMDSTMHVSDVPR